MEEEKGDLYVFAIVITVLSIISLIISILALTNNALSIVGFIISLLITAFDLAIFWTINGISKKVNKLVNLLEKKKVITSADTQVVDGLLENGEDVSYCKNCGYQLFVEDKECPNCHMARKTQKKQQKK